jgi:hypothetical protein
MPNSRPRTSPPSERSVQMRPLGNTFRRIVDVLNGEDIRYVVIGALAVRAYIPGRRSNDVDLLVAPSNVARVIRASAVDFDLIRTRGDEVTLLRDRRNGIEVHVRAAYEKSDRQALSSAISIPLFHREVRIPAPEYLVVMKLASMRGHRKHWEDVLALLKADCIDVRFVIAHLVREHPGLCELFMELVAEATPKSRRRPS